MFIREHLSSSQYYRMSKMYMYVYWAQKEVQNIKFC